MLSVKTICDITGRKKSTVYNWLKEGLVPTDEKTILEWKEQKEAEARGAAKDASESLRSATGTADTFDPANSPPAGDPGAPHCLKRLQELEVELHRRLQAAMQSGDDRKVRIAQQTYDRTASTLLKYEKEIDQYLRDTGELISRREMLNGIAAAANWMRLGFVQWVSACLPDILALSDNPRAAKAKIIETFPGSLVAAIRQSQDSQLPVPKDIEKLVAQEFRLQELMEPDIVYRSDLGWCKQTPLADIPIQYPTAS